MYWKENLRCCVVNVCFGWHVEVGVLISRGRMLWKLQVWVLTGLSLGGILILTTKTVVFLKFVEKNKRQIMCIFLGAHDCKKTRMPWIKDVKSSWNDQFLATWWFQICFIFIPNPGEMIQLWRDNIFQNGLVQPPTRLVFFWAKNMLVVHKDEGLGEGTRLRGDHWRCGWWWMLHDARCSNDVSYWYRTHLSEDEKTSYVFKNSTKQKAPACIWTNSQQIIPMLRTKTKSRFYTLLMISWDCPRGIWWIAIRWVSSFEPP